MDTQFESISGHLGGPDFPLIITVPSEFVTVAHRADSNEIEIRITGQQEATDFLKACGAIWAMTVVGDIRE